MKVYLTKINGWSLREYSHYIQHMVLEIAHQLGCREMGIYRYNAEAEGIESRNSRLDGIIAGINRGDIVICQFPTGNGLKFEKALVNHVKAYGARIAIFVHKLEALADESKSSTLQETIGLYNQAEVLVVPTYAMRNFLMDHGIRKEMKFVMQEMWDYMMDDRFFHAPTFRKEIHVTDSDSSAGINGWNCPVALKLYAGISNGGKNVQNMGEMEPPQMISELSKGGFGLVWYKDEHSRRYMEYSASFTLTRYLAAGIPVIVSAGISSRSVIEENHLGLVVNSLEEAAAAVETMEEAEYREYVKCVEQFAPALRRGYYTKKCLINAMQAFYRKEAGRIFIPEESYNLKDCRFTSTELHESYGGSLALSWNFTGKPDGFLIYDASSGAVLHDIRNVYQHYFLLKSCVNPNGFMVKAYVDTLRGKLIIAESEQTYIWQREYVAPKVSMIIPAYNAEDYIVRCIDTILAQSQSDVEIIVVDDGSTDYTPEIIDWYAEKYANVVVIHQKNGGAAAARNTGIACAKGEYLGFMDSDDMLRPNMIKNLYLAIKKNDCDIAITSAYQMTDNGYREWLRYPMEQDVPKDIDEFFNMHFLKGCAFMVVIWNKLYRTSLVKAHFFPLLLHEDGAWTPYILSYANRICYLDDCSYEYNMMFRKDPLSSKLLSKTEDVIFINHKKAILFYLENGGKGKLELLKKLAVKQLSELARAYKKVEYKNLMEQIIGKE